MHTLPWLEGYKFESVNGCRHMYSVDERISTQSKTAHATSQPSVFCHTCILTSQPTQPLTMLHTHATSRRQHRHCDVVGLCQVPVPCPTEWARLRSHGSTSPYTTQSHQH